MIKTTILILGVVFASYYLGIYRASASDGHLTNEELAGRPHSDEMMVFDFSTEADPSGWEVEDDVVMGGRSKGAFLSMMRETGSFPAWCHSRTMGDSRLYSTISSPSMSHPSAPLSFGLKAMASVTNFLWKQTEKDNITMSTNSRRLKLGRRWRFP